MTEPIVTRTKGYAMRTQDQLLDEIQRLEGLVASVTAERDSARTLCAASGYFQSAQDDESKHKHVLNPATCDYCGCEIKGKYCDWCDDEPDRPSAHDMPVGSVVVAMDRVREAYIFTRTDNEPGGWSDGTKNTIQSGWIEGLFSDGLVTEWRLP